MAPAQQLLAMLLKPPHVRVAVADALLQVVRYQCLFRPSVWSHEQGEGGGTDGSLDLVEFEAAGKALLGQEAHLRDHELVQLIPVLLDVLSL